MYLCDCHTHSNFSADVPPERPDSIDRLCARAAELGLSYLAVTDHYDILWDRTGAAPDFPFAERDAALKAAKEKWKGKLEIAYGIEYAGAFMLPSGIGPTLGAYPYDIVLGSLHNLYGYPSFADFDFTAYSETERKDILCKYLDGWLSLIRCDGNAPLPARFDIYTHPTYPLRYLLRQGIPFDIREWESPMKAMFREIIAKGAGIEFNTSALRYRLGIPDRTVYDAARWYREAGGELIILSSDAHDPKDVAAGLRDAAEYLRDIGFRYHATFIERHPIYHKL